MALSLSGLYCPGSAAAVVVAVLAGFFVAVDPATSVCLNKVAYPLHPSSPSPSPAASPSPSISPCCGSSIFHPRHSTVPSPLTDSPPPPFIPTTKPRQPLHRIHGRDGTCLLLVIGVEPHRAASCDGGRPRGPRPRQHRHQLFREGDGICSPAPSGGCRRQVPEMAGRRVRAVRRRRRASTAPPANKRMLLAGGHAAARAREREGGLGGINTMEKEHGRGSWPRQWIQTPCRRVRQGAAAVLAYFRMHKQRSMPPPPPLVSCRHRSPPGGFFPGHSMPHGGTYSRAHSYVCRMRVSVFLSLAQRRSVQRRWGPQLICVVHASRTCATVGGHPYPERPSDGGHGPLYHDVKVKYLHLVLQLLGVHQGVHKQPLVLKSSALVTQPFQRRKYDDSASTWDPGLSFFYFRQRRQTHPSVVGILVLRRLFRPFLHRRYAWSVHPVYTSPTYETSLRIPLTSGIIIRCALVDAVVFISGHRTFMYFGLSWASL